MAEKTVKGKAPWLLGEIIPILITFALGAGSLVLGATGVWAWGGAIFGAVVGLGLTAFLLWVNAGRKKKSTLVAELKTDRKYGIKVWMVSPNKLKWNGKLDKGKNTANLIGNYKVEVADVQGTKILIFHVARGKQFIVPVRFFRDNASVAQYFADAKELSKWNASAEAKEVFEEFFPTANITAQEELKAEEPAIVFEEEADESWNEEEVYGVAEEEQIPQERPFKVTQRIAYPVVDKEEEKTVEDQVTEAFIRDDERIAKEAEDALPQLDSSLYGLGGDSKNSITIDLGDSKNK